VRVFVAVLEHQVSAAEVMCTGSTGKREMSFLGGRKEVKALHACIVCLPLCSLSSLCPFVEMICRELGKMNVSKQFVFLLQACQWVGGLGAENHLVSGVPARCGAVGLDDL